MNLYIKTINETIDYIEEHITNKLTQIEISKQFSISQYHFNRMFKTVVGQTIKQYVLERKLSYAYQRIKYSKDTIIDIAYEYGFEYPEVFSRAFKKQYGITPIECRKLDYNEVVKNRIRVVERDLVNYGGGITIKGEFIKANPIEIIGISVEVNENDKDFEDKLRQEGEKFSTSLKKISHNDGFYTVVNCHNDDSGVYTLFHGIDYEKDTNRFFSQLRLIPQGWYVEFIYYGDIVEMKETFINDLYRWLMVKEVEISNNGIGMFNIYQHDYLERKAVKIRIPIQVPN